MKRYNRNNENYYIYGFSIIRLLDYMIIELKKIKVILITAISLYRHWTCHLPMNFKYKIEVSVNNVLYILELKVKWVIHFRNEKRKKVVWIFWSESNIFPND